MKRGDVILCAFPHSGSPPGKKRPALVVQSDHYNHRIANLLVAGITGNLTNANDAAHYLIDVSTPTGQPSGLNRNSLVSCINLAVLPPRDVGRKIGELPDDAMEQISECLKAAMDI
ncbi:MAG: type II toxin-antitoxin system PemK/MazF family toxin [Planctomycetes bacterium]|nr:type II toxin-antitoxin system PemK/MazF family toxin [Planctomycetota bacterium]